MHPQILQYLANERAREMQLTANAARRARQARRARRGYQAVAVPSRAVTCETSVLPA